MESVKSYMTARAYTIGAEQLLPEARQLMTLHGIRHLPVLRNGKLHGVISDRDLKLAFAVDGDSAKKSNVGESCSLEAYSADVNEPLKKVCAEMARRVIGCCMVTEHDKVVGIFTATDACRVLSEVLE